MKIDIIINEGSEVKKLSLPITNLEKKTNTMHNNPKILKVTIENEYDEKVFEYIKDSSLYEMNKFVSIYNQLSKVEVMKLLFLMNFKKENSYKEINNVLFSLDKVMVDKNISSNKDLVLSRNKDVLNEFDNKTNDFIDELANIIMKKENGLILESKYYYIKK